MLPLAESQRSVAGVHVDTPPGHFNIDRIVLPGDGEDGTDNTDADVRGGHLHAATPIGGDLVASPAANMVEGDKRVGLVSNGHLCVRKEHHSSGIAQTEDASGVAVAGAGRRGRIRRDG